MAVIWQEEAPSVLGGFSVVLEEAHGTAHAKEAVSLSAASGMGMWSLHHEQSTHSTHSCQALPFVVSAFSSHSGWSGVLLLMTFIPSSSLGYKNGSYDSWPFHTALCTEAERLCNSCGLAQLNIFILTATN